MTDITDVIDVLTDEQIERLKDGEEISIALELREPITGGFPTSFDQLELQLSTRGTMKSLESVDQLPQEFPETENLEELVEEYKDD
jgi:hypothetical protein